MNKSIHTKLHIHNVKKSRDHDKVYQYVLTFIEPDYNLPNKKKRPCIYAMLSYDQYITMVDNKQHFLKNIK